MNLLTLAKYGKQVKTLWRLGLASCLVLEVMRQILNYLNYYKITVYMIGRVA